MLKALLGSRNDKALGAALYAAIAERARHRVFFTEFAIPDTVDGRFDLVTLHAWIVLEVLRTHEMRNMSQALIDALFVSFDEGLRELGVGDIGLGHRIKKMADAFYGRLSAYRAAADEPALAAAIARNLYRGETGHEHHAEVLAYYAIAAQAGIERGDLKADSLDFGPLPQMK